MLQIARILLRTTATLGGLVALLAGQPAAANELKLVFGDGRVTIVAHEVTVDNILGEWARQGQTIIVNANDSKLTGSPVTLALEDVPEAEALDVVLRAASGYVASYRTRLISGTSAFQRIVILPTSKPPAAPPARPSAPIALGVSPTGSLRLTSPQSTKRLDEEQPRLKPPPTPQYADRPGVPSTLPQTNTPSAPTPVPTK